MTGASGEDAVVHVPLGTQVLDAERRAADRRPRARQGAAS